MKQSWVLIFTMMIVLLGCRPEAACAECVPTLIPIVQIPTPLPSQKMVPTLIPTDTAVSPPATITNQPIQQPSNTPTISPSPTPTNRPEPVFCNERLPVDNLLVIVTKTYGLSPAYEPPDLVPVDDYFERQVTLGYLTEVRVILIEPLSAMIGDMQLAGLYPQILSGYRSYAAQAIAYNKWMQKHPDRANILSAPPGFSEHQLGTTVDFGSPELVDIVGEGFEFHTYFYQTSEGIWLAENAHKYGFTLSYPREALELTGFYYEPWHFRYVGVEVATRLKEQNLTLTEQQLSNFPAPCIPEE